MKNNSFVTIARPKNPVLSQIVDFYFYIDTTVLELREKSEIIFPFPRITFAYFFDHPFVVTNHSINKSFQVNLFFSKISTQKICLRPYSDKIKVFGAVLKPYALAYFNSKPISSFNWLIDVEKMVGKGLDPFVEQILGCNEIEERVNAIENLLMLNFKDRDLSLIARAIELTEENFGKIDLSDLASYLGVKDRTLRNHFYEYIGCSPNEYYRVLKMKQLCYQIKNSENLLLDSSLGNREVAKVNGNPSKHIRKEVPNFRLMEL
jgi:AraC-like DNA-binding protein